MARVTLKDIAQRAEVSVSAVSLALSGKGNISQPQRDRIRRLARELGYSPNPLLASLASKRFRTGDDAQGTLIAHLEFPVDEDRPTPAIYGPELERYAKDLGFQLRVMDSADMRRHSDLPGMLYRCGTQGVIVTGQPPPGFFKEHHKWESFALVQCGRFRTNLPIHTVRSDVFRSIKLIFQQVRALGYERIGFSVGRHSNVLEDDEARLGSAMAMLHFHLPPHRHVTPFTGNFDDGEGLLAWVRAQQPEVVIGFSIRQYHILATAGFRIPEEIGFATLHVPETPELGGAPGCAGLFQQTNRIARESLRLLDQLIRYKVRGFPETPRHTLIPSVWRQGKTLRKLEA